MFKVEERHQAGSVWHERALFWRLDDADVFAQMALKDGWVIRVVLLTGRPWRSYWRDSAGHIWAEDGDGKRWDATPLDLKAMIDNGWTAHGLCVGRRDAAPAVGGTVALDDEENNDEIS